MDNPDLGLIKQSIQVNITEFRLNLIDSKSFTLGGCPLDNIGVLNPHAGETLGGLHADTPSK